MKYLQEKGLLGGGVMLKYKTTLLHHPLLDVSRFRTETDTDFIKVRESFTNGKA